jgi:hypothetical protein
VEASLSNLEEEVVKMAPKFYTQEWANVVAEKMNSDTDYLKKVKSLTFHWCAIVTDCPSGVDRKLDWELKEGRAVSDKVTEAPAPSEWREGIPKGNYFCVVYGSYETYAKMNRKELTPLAALSQKVYRMDTDMVQFMANIGPLVAWTDLMASVPCEY